MDLQKMLLIYELMGGNGNTDPQPPDQEFTITVESNVDAIFTSNGLTFVNGVAKTMIAGTYQITAQAEGYNSEKKSITVNNLNPNGFWYFDLTEQSTDPSEAWKAEYSVKVLVNGEEPTRAYQYYYYSYDSNSGYSNGESYNNVGEIVLKHAVEDFDSNNMPEEIEFYVHINDKYDASKVFTNEPTLVKIDNGKAYYYLGEMNVEIEDELVEYKIVANSNVENAIFKGYNYEYNYQFSFVNKVAQIAKKSHYTVLCSAPGYIGQKAYVELTEIEPTKEIYFELEKVNSGTGDPSKASKAEYSFEVTVNGETSKGNKEITAYFNNNFENIYKKIEFISSGKIVVKYLDENFNGYSTSSFDLDLSINGIPNGNAYESLAIENPVLTKVENGVAYYSFGTIDVTIEDEPTAPNYSIYVYSNPSGVSFVSDGLVFNNGFAEVSGVGEYSVNATKPGYYDKNFVVKVTEENPNAVYKVNLDKTPVKHTITATANTPDANFSSSPYIPFNKDGVGEVYEEGEYEIQCFADGYIEQRKIVTVDSSNQNIFVHFDLEVDIVNPPFFENGIHRFTLSINGKTSGWKSWIGLDFYNGSEMIMNQSTWSIGLMKLEYIYQNGKMLSDPKVDIQLGPGGANKGIFDLKNPTVEDIANNTIYIKYDSIYLYTEYVITVTSNVANTTFTSPNGLNFVNGVAKTTAQGTYEVTAKADGHEDQTRTFYVGDSNPAPYINFEW